MLACPLLSAVLLPCAVPLPGALLLPSPLLLPRDCLLLRTLRLWLLPVGLLGLRLRTQLPGLLDPLRWLLRRRLDPLLW